MKSALLIGCNYRGTSSELRGCINDVNLLRVYLRNIQKYDRIVELTDDTPIKPTKNNIIIQLVTLVRNARPGDSLFVLFSGHGSLVRDRDGDEKTGYDSCICPLDYMKSGTIIDDDLRRQIIDRVPRGVNMQIILDCCHNGTGCDLRYTINDTSIVKDTEQNRKIINDSSLTLVQKACKLEFDVKQNIEENPKYNKTIANVTMFAGSGDYQSSADAFENGNYGGAFTMAYMEILRESGEKFTDKEKLYRMLWLLERKGYSQKCRLMSSMV